MKTELIPVTERSLSELAELATRIWHEHYDAILGREQVDYMLENFQSVRAVAEQLSRGAVYKLLKADGVPVGYYAYADHDTRTFLSKLYLLKEMRGKGLGRLMLNDAAEHNPARPIYLTVNKRNAASIAAYRALGFRTIGKATTDIGNGYFMDDYVMQKDL